MNSNKNEEKEQSIRPDTLYVPSWKNRVLLSDRLFKL